MHRIRFGDTAIEREILAQPHYRRAVWSARLAFPFCAAALVSAITAAATGSEDPRWFVWFVVGAFPFLGFCAFNAMMLRVFIKDGKGYRTLPVSMPSSDDLLWRTVYRIWLGALFIARRRRRVQLLPEPQGQVLEFHPPCGGLSQEPIPSLTKGRTGSTEPIWPPLRAPPYRSRPSV